MRSFCEAFKPDDNVELWIKTDRNSVNPLVEIPRIANEYPGMKDKIYIIKTHFHDMSMLYQLFDSFVLPVALEGFGMTFLEAMACGLKPIGPAYGGTSEFMNESNAYLCEMDDWEPIDATGMPHGLFAPDTKWRVPQKDAVIEAMRLACQKREFLTKSQRAALRKKWSWENSAKMLAKELETLVRK